MRAPSSTCRSNNGVFNPNAGTVIFNGNAQSIGGSFITVFNNLTISGSGTKSLLNNETVIGTLTVNPFATLDISSYNLSAPSAIQLYGGATTGSIITGSSGTLSLGGNVTVNSANTGSSAAIISCFLALGNNSTRTFIIADDGTTATDLVISGSIFTSGALTKTGPGTMVLSGVNNYTSVTTISNGNLRLGGTGTTIPGDININGGTLDYSNTTNEQIANTSNMTLSSGIFDPAARAETIGSLTMTGGSLIKGGNTQ